MRWFGFSDDEITLLLEGLKSLPPSAISTQLQAQLAVSVGSEAAELPLETLDVTTQESEQGEESDQDQTLDVTTQEPGQGEESDQDRYCCLCHENGANTNCVRSKAGSSDASGDLDITMQEPEEEEEAGEPDDEDAHQTDHRRRHHRYRCPCHPNRCRT